MSLSDSKEQIWLVKSSGVVRGPFSFIQLIGEIKNRNIAILDEVRTPRTRWNFVREQKELSDIVKAIRDEDAIAPQETGVTHTAINLEVTKSITLDIPQAQAQDGMINDELTPEPEFGKRKSQKKSEPVSSASRFPKETEAVPIPILGTAGPQRKKGNAKKWLYLLPVFVVAGFTYYFFDVSKSKKMAVKSDELVKVAQQYKVAGLYEKARSLYENAYKMAPLSVQAKKEYITLELIADSPSLMLEKMMAEMDVNGEKMGIPATTIQNWRGMFLHRQGKFQEADQAFEKAISADIRNTAAVTNRIVNDYFLRRPDIAIQHYLEARQNGSLNQNSILSAATSVLLMDPNTQAENMKAIFADIQNWVKVHYEGASEMTLLSAAISARMSQLSDSENHVLKLMEIMPQGKLNFIPEVDMLRSFSDWANYESVCNTIALAHAGKLTELLVKTYCQTEKGDFQKAWQLIEEIQSKFSESNKHLGVQAYLLKSMNRLPEAKIIISTSSQMIAKLIQSDLCYREKDLVCAESAANEVLQKDPMNIYAHYWIAKVASLKNNKEFAKQEVNKGLMFSPYFLPLVELKEELYVH